MNDRDDIAKRVQSFKTHQEKLAREREARMDAVIRQIRQTLAEMHAREKSG
jgi:hypothetical protein